MSWRRSAITISVLLPSLLLLAGAVFWPALAGPFLFDDFHNLGNLGILGGVVDVSGLRDYLASFPGTVGRPLSAMSFIINDHAWPSDPRSFKYTNLLIHLLNGVLVFGLTRVLAGLRTSSTNVANWIALATTFIWLVHPIQVSAAMLTIQRMTLLAASFGLAGLWAYVALASRATDLRGAATAVVALGVGTVLAILCKENGALLPLLALVINATLLRDRLEQSPHAVRRALAIGVIVPCAILAIAFASELTNPGAFARRDFTMIERLLTQARILCDYLLHIVVPRLSGAGIYFDDYPVSRSVFEPLSTLPALAALGGLLGAGFALRQRAPLIAFGILWFLCGHVLESTALPLELYFEHRNYVPLLGPVLALVTLAGEATGGMRRPLFAGLVAWAMLLALISHVQARVWGNERALTTLWAAEHPRSERAALHRGEFLARQGEAQAARDFLVAATKLQPGSAAVPLQVLLVDCQTRHQVTESELEFYRLRLSTGTFSNASMPALATVRRLIQAGGCAGMDTSDWIALADAALLNPHFAVLDALAYLRVERGYAYASGGNMDAAKREFALAYAAESSPGMALNIALVMLESGDTRAAGEWAQRASASRIRGLAGVLSQDQARARRLHEEILRRSTALPPAR